MKKFTQRLIVAISLFLTATACKKTVTETPTPAPPSSNTAISKIEVDDNIVKITYNNDGTIQKVVSEPTNNTAATNYLFSYENGKLKEVSFGGKWKYTYNGDLLVKVETILVTGKPKYQVDFIYNGNKVIEKTESIVNELAGLSPSMKTTYQYYASGNVSKKEVFQYINKEWKKTEEMSVLEYDNKVNAGERFESYPYLPNIIFSQNNSLREVWRDGDGNLDAQLENQYVYDSQNRPTSKKMIFKYPGFPDVVSEIKYHY